MRLIFLVPFLIILAGCTIEKKICTIDSDCTCGGIDKETGQCYVGNIDYYDKNVDKEKVCPDFCTGIAGHLETRCVNSTCNIVQKKINECNTNNDCSIGGCSGQLCVLNSKAQKGSGMISTCEFLPEYACYKLSTCGCTEGKCKWQDNPGFKKCLDEN